MNIINIMIVLKGWEHMKKTVFLVFGQNRNLKNQIHLCLQKWGIESNIQW